MFVVYKLFTIFACTIRHVKEHVTRENGITTRLKSPGRLFYRGFIRVNLINFNSVIMEKLKKIIDKYSVAINIPVNELTGSSRKMELSIARQAFWKSAINTCMPIEILCKYFGRKKLAIKKGMKHVDDLCLVNDSYAMYCVKTCDKLFSC